MASHSSRSDSFSSFLDILKSVLAQTQNLFEGLLSDNRVASLDALENLSIKMDEICKTLVVFLNSIVNPTGDTWQQLYDLLCAFYGINKYHEEETPTSLVRMKKMQGCIPVLRLLYVPREITEAVLGMKLMNNR